MTTNEHVEGAVLPGHLGMEVRLVSQPGARLALLDWVNHYADNLEQELGTEAIVVSLDSEDKDMEWFTSIEAFKDRRKAHSFADLMKELPTLLSQPPAILRIGPLRMFIQKYLFDCAF